MKILFEVPLRTKDRGKSHFSWLRNRLNWLFLIEDGKRMKTISIDHEPGKELQSATLADKRTCTSLSWNKDGSVLALVVDRRQIYFWEVQNNNFVHFRPFSKLSVDAKKSRTKQQIELVKWSKVSNKLVVGYSTGQILLCNCDSNLSETFIDNSDGVLSRICSIETSDHLDLFVCLTEISELLVMTFDGETKFYAQSEDLIIVKAKFSPSSVDATTTWRGGDRVSVANSSAPTRQTTKDSELSVWLAYQLKSGRILFKKIVLQDFYLTETMSKIDVAYDDDDDDNDGGGDEDGNECLRSSSQLVDFHWITFSSLITCFSSGVIMLVQVKNNSQIGQASLFTLTSEQILNIWQGSDDSYDESSSLSSPPPSSLSTQTTLQPPNRHHEDFIAFELQSYQMPVATAAARTSARGPITSSTKASHERSFSLAATTSHKLFYYELTELDQRQAMYAFDKVDDLDLTESLQRMSLELERVEWCYDCSMLAVKLTNNHILVYQTRLQNYQVVSYGPKIAYLSGANEITVLDYGTANETQDNNSNSKSTIRNAVAGADETTTQSPATTNTNNNALTISVDFRPSVIGIGRAHLAVALNNRVRFYQLSGEQANESVSLVDEQEYVSIVVGLCLCSRFVAVHFNDGRLKLHAIKSLKRRRRRPSPSGMMVAPSAGYNRRLLHHNNYNRDDNDDDDDDDDEADGSDGAERFFPDPTKPEQITAFVLTEDLFVYCTHQRRLNVFSLRDWTLVQVSDHSRLFDGPIVKLVANERGNKFVCLMREASAAGGKDNVCIYDLYTNSMIEFAAGAENRRVYSKMFASQSRTITQPMLAGTLAVVESVARMSPTPEGSTGAGVVAPSRPPKLNRIKEAIWDTDGRTVLLIERKCIHYAVLLEHTLECEEPLIEYVASAGKASSYTALYASHGVISFQTSLGRVMNSISEPHDEEPKLARLEQQVQFIRQQQQQQAAAATASDAPAELAQAQVMRLKLAFLRTILPIYSLSKCKQICEHLMSDEQFNFSGGGGGKPTNTPATGAQQGRRESSGSEIESIIWRHLAAWALFTMNLNFALLVYRKHGLLVHARVLSEIISDARLKGLDGRTSVRTRVMVLLGCELEEGGGEQARDL